MIIMTRYIDFDPKRPTTHDYKYYDLKNQLKRN